MLKSHFLDGKRNRRIDFLIHTLVNEMVPYYQNRHAQQAVGLEGPDLAEKRRRQLLAHAKGSARDSIQQFDSTQFHVASESNPGLYYEIDLNQLTCNCRDFPRSRFCKHLAAIYVHFPHLCPKESRPPIDLKIGGTLDPPQGAPITEIRRTSSPQESVQTLLQEIKLLSQQLDDKIGGLADDPGPDVVRAIQLAKHSLIVAIASTQGLGPLPDKENVPWNQNTWAETAERMGCKCAPKRAPKRRLSGEHGITERSIGTRKAHKHLHTDPYAGGERSGKRAKPDALSATANARARAPPPLPPPNSLPSPSPLPSFPPSAFAREPTALIPGSSKFIPQSFALAPGLFRACALPPAQGGFGNMGTLPFPFGARDFDLGAAPVTLGAPPLSGDPALVPAPKTK